jgi:hypothetical protein
MTSTIVSTDCSDLASLAAVTSDVITTSSRDHHQESRYVDSNAPPVLTSVVSSYAVMLSNPAPATPVMMMIVSSQHLPVLTSPSFIRFAQLGGAVMHQGGAFYQVVQPLFIPQQHGMRVNFAPGMMDAGGNWFVSPQSEPFIM